MRQIMHCPLTHVGFSTLSQITDRLIISANMRSVLLFSGNSGNSLWLSALGASVGSRVCVMLKKNFDTEVPYGSLNRNG